MHRLLHRRCRLRSPSPDPAVWLPDPWSPPPTTVAPCQAEALSGEPGGHFTSPAHARLLSDPCINAPLEVGSRLCTTGSAYPQLAWEGSLGLDPLPAFDHWCGLSVSGSHRWLSPPPSGASPHCPCLVRCPGYALRACH
jgi:hypothetical protein